MKTKFWKTTIVFEVLTEDPAAALPDDMGLRDIVDMTIGGLASGAVTSLESEEVTHSEMKELLMRQGSCPEFLDPFDWEDEDSQSSSESEGA